MSERDTDDTIEANVEEGYDSNPADQGRWLSALVVLAGAWLVVQPFLVDLVALHFWNNVLVGLALIVLGGFNYYRRAADRLASTAAAGLVALLGLWMIAVPFVLDATINFVVVPGPFGFWNDIIVGLIVLGLGLYSVYEARDVDQPTALGQ
ncbi:MAG: hypothetical protein ABEJ31_04225 [Haloarculaceae archaeon]